jgi:uncharacterized glyoxalase superfamily protein PhnB
VKTFIRLMIINYDDGAANLTSPQYAQVSGARNGVVTEVFNRLSQGGRVDMPLAKQFWGAHSASSRTSSASTGWST